MLYRLPPLNALCQFEAAGRHLSFRHAAEELHVTPSAVSHGVQALEDWLGVELFVRQHRGLSLTADGALYLPRIQEILNQLARASKDLPGHNGAQRLSVSVAPSFAKRWLVPNLAEFHQAHPNIEVSLDTSHRLVSFPQDGVDMAIRIGNGDWSGVSVDCLFMECLVPVCVPEVAAHIQTVDDLQRQNLLHVSNAGADWAAWAKAVDACDLDVERGFRFDTVDMAISAAMQGLGVAMGRLPLVQEELNDGRLVTVLGEPQPCNSGYWLICADKAADSPEIGLFRDWLKQAFQGRA